MKLNLLKNTVLFIVVNLIAYITITVLGEIYSTSFEIEIFERVHIGFSFLILFFIVMEIKRGYLFLMSLFIFATFWYTFECEKKFLFIVYVVWQVVFLSLLLAVKAIYSWLSRSSYEKNI